MKGLKIFFISFIVLISIFGFTGCSNKDKLKGCAFTLISNGEEYEISQEYKMSSKGPSGNISIPDTYKGLKVSSIGSFSCCHGITSVTGNINIITITKNAFGCRCQETMRAGKMKLKKVEFSKNSNLKIIENEAFFKCSKLEEIYLSENFESFEDGVFFGCIALTRIYIYNPTPPTGAAKLFSSGLYSHKPHNDFAVYVPSEAVDTYKNSAWGNFNIKPIAE